MTEFRQDRTSGAWVIVAPERNQRPILVASAKTSAPPLPPFDATCPFCPGNERELLGIVAEIPADTPPGWQVRAVPNKFPAVEGQDVHEVVIDHPLHNADLVTMDDAAIRAVMEMYYQRFIDLASRPGIVTVVLFRNRGSGSGASMPHPHTQLIALRLPTPKLRALATWGEARFRAEGRCATCAEIEWERATHERVVDDTAHFLTIVPFAAERPSEMWIVPTRHQGSFVEIADAERAAFAIALREALRRLVAVHGSVPYNFVLDSAGVAGRGVPYIHWRLRIMPQLTTWGGFELGTGIPINPSSPERDAGELRASLG